MNGRWTVAMLLLAVGCAATDHGNVDAHARELAHETIILDGHIDVPYRLHDGWEDVSVSTDGGDFDWPRAVEGGLDAPFMSIYVPASLEQEGGSKELADELIDMVERIAAESPDKFVVARSAADVRRAHAEGRIALLMGMENGSPIEGDLANVDYFYKRGIRYITLCHSADNHIADSSYCEEPHEHQGLTPFGEQVVRRMNDVGIMVDVSHVSDETFWDVMEVTTAPVIASHSSLRYFTPGFERNMSDEMVRRLGENGGVVQINFGSMFLDSEFNRAMDEMRAARAAYMDEHELERDSDEVREFMRKYREEHPVPYADVGTVADHIDRVVELAGIDHVGLGSDFDGVGDSLPTGLKDVSQYPNLIAELLRRGYSDRDVEKICSGNVLRVMTEVERRAR